MTKTDRHSGGREPGCGARGTVPLRTSRDRSRTLSIVGWLVLLLPLAGIGCGPVGPPQPPPTEEAEPSLRFEPRFEDYPTGPSENVTAPAPVDLTSHPEGRTYRTALARGAAQGPNFAGVFTVVTWGCGTMCQRSMIVDARTGGIVADLTASLSFAFQLESRLLVVNPPAAVEENPCPACSPEYHLLAEDGRLLRIPEEALSGAVPPPPHQHDFVARTRAEEISAGLREQAPLVERNGWDRLVITAENGSRHLFLDDTAGGEIRHLHRFAGRIERLDAYLVERRYVPHGGEYLLIDARTGAITSIDAPPTPSPDGIRFATAAIDLVAGHGPNRIRIYRLVAREPTLEWEIEPSGWGARDPVWLDPETIRLERSVVDWNGIRLQSSAMLLRHEREGWTVQPSAEHARDALLSFFSALANEQYVEATWLYGGSYEVLRGWNPDHDPEDLPGLWRLGCRHNGLQCLGRAEVIRVEPVTARLTRLVVRLMSDAGEPFVLGPCCGATEEEMPPQHEFGFTVARVENRYLVQDLPVYVP